MGVDRITNRKDLGNSFFPQEVQAPPHSSLCAIESLVNSGVMYCYATTEPGTNNSVIPIWKDDIQRGHLKRWVEDSPSYLLHNNPTYTQRTKDGHMSLRAIYTGVLCSFVHTDAGWAHIPMLQRRNRHFDRMDDLAEPGWIFEEDDMTTFVGQRLMTPDEWQNFMQSNAQSRDVFLSTNAKLDLVRGYSTIVLP